MKKILTSTKFKHGSMATVFTAVFIAIVIAINIVCAVITDRYPSLNIDLTAQGLNSLSDETEEIVADVAMETEIYLIGPESDYMNDILYASAGLQYSQVAYIALKMEESNSNITVEFIDPDLQPQLISEYANDDLSAGDVLIRTENRYKVLAVDDMFGIQENTTTGEYVYYTYVDSALANAVYLVNLEDVPTISIATGHDEMLGTDSLTSFYSLAENNGFTVQDFNILSEEIPEDTDILLVATPTTDYSVEEIAKLEAFLGEMAEDKVVMFTCYPSQGDLPNIETFLADWGLVVEDNIVIEGDATKAFSSNPTFFLTDSVWDGLADNTYSYILSAYTSSIDLTFVSNNDIATYALLQTSDQAYATADGTTSEDASTGVQTVAAMARTLLSENNTTVYSSLVVFGGTVQFTDSYLGNSTFGNNQYLIDLLQALTGVTDAEQSLYTTSVQTSSVDIISTGVVISVVGLYTLTIGIPLIVLLCGLVVFLRRRHL